MSVQQIIDLQNENAKLRRELDERKRCCRCGHPVVKIPAGHRAVEAYMSDTEIVVLGHVESDDETHSCDAMGCGSLGAHVVERLIRNARPASRVEEAARRALAAIDALIAESRGVDGLHRNGDVAPWDELTTGGQFEGWLAPLDDLRAVLAAEGEEG